MSLSRIFKRKAALGRDLFGQKLPPAISARAETIDLAEDLRRISERAYHAGLDRSCSLIEVAAQMVEMEGIDAR